MIKITIEANTNKNITGIKKFNLINFIIKHSVIYYQSEELQESSPEVNINNSAEVIEFLESKINQAISKNMNHKIIEDYNVIIHNQEKKEHKKITDIMKVITNYLYKNNIIKKEVI